MHRVIFVLYDEVESLDVVGPYDVFSMANVISGSHPLFKLTTVSEKGGPIHCLGGLTISAEYALNDLTITSDDVLVVPGGPPSVMGQFPTQYPDTLDWIRSQQKAFGAVVSICFGALILAHAGVLDGQQVTTHHQALDALKKLAPKSSVQSGARYVDNRPAGKFMSSAGVSAGIDWALHFLSTVSSEDVAARTARVMEYNRTINYSA